MDTCHSLTPHLTMKSPFHSQLIHNVLFKGIVNATDINGKLNSDLNKKINCRLEDILKTRKHSNLMRTARLLAVSHSIPCILGVGGLPNPLSPSDADLPPNWRQTPWSCDLWCILGSQPPSPSPCGQQNTCENITLLQTSFADGQNNDSSDSKVYYCRCLLEKGLLIFVKCGTVVQNQTVQLPRENSRTDLTRDGHCSNLIYLLGLQKSGYKETCLDQTGSYLRCCMNRP